jgi:hypothetical protein
LPHGEWAGPGGDGETLHATKKKELALTEKPKNEISKFLFDSTCRRSLPMEDKFKVNSNHIMEGLDKGYLMTTNRSPKKIMSINPKQ